jgi:hypothetical protein
MTQRIIAAGLGALVGRYCLSAGGRVGEFGPRRTILAGGRDRRDPALIVAFNVGGDDALSGSGCGGGKNKERAGSPFTLLPLSSDEPRLDRVYCGPVASPGQF